jgi:hypothetical protein
LASLKFAQAPMSKIAAKKVLNLSSVVREARLKIKQLEIGKIPAE